MTMKPDTGVYDFRVIEDIPCPLRIRGMGVDTTLRSEGLGSRLLLHAIDHLRQSRKNGWGTARIHLIPWEEKLGARSVGCAFDIPGTGLHRTVLFECDVEGTSRPSAKP
jgi:GNAT superfamily N-acetyltransferase